MLTVSPDRLTERQQQLLDAIRSAGTWVNRADLATATGKNRLSPHDIGLLERLVTDGYIEVRMGESASLRGKEHQYRSTSH